MAQMTESKRVTLYCREGGSDKEYTLWLEGDGNAFVVNFQYGRRGGTQNPGTKTKAPITLAEAEKVYDKIVKEKRAKGYVEGQNSAAYTQTTGAVDSGLRPMLLTPDTEDSLEAYLTDPAWVAQEKMNGIRLILKASDGKVTGVNRKGLERAIPQELSDALAGGEVELDGELIGSKFYAFDILSYGTLQLRTDPLFSRLDTLKKVILRIGSPTILLVPTFTGESSKRGLLRHLRDGSKEGIVFKKQGGEYEAGRRENLKKALAVKVKFYRECDATITGWNKDKASVAIEAADGTPIGNVTIPDKYADQIRTGRVLRVRYLFATDGNQLYQPKVDPTDDGQITRTDGRVVKVDELVHEGKDE